MTRNKLAVEVHQDGSATITLPQGDKCWNCKGDGKIIYDPPVPMKYGPPMKSITVLHWCHNHVDFECSECSSICRKGEFDVG